jgi:outer membrane protein OmpA-like peptidoglycan-associated protein
MNEKRRVTSSNYFIVCQTCLGCYRTNIEARGHECVKSSIIIEEFPQSFLLDLIRENKKLDKDFTGINIVFFSESGMVLNTSKVSKNGEFSYSKLPTKKGVLMMIQDNDGVLQGSKSITVKGQVTGVNKFINVDNTSFYIVDANNEKYLASKLSSKGNFQFEIKLEDYELVPRVKETPTFEEIKPSSENKVVSKNIYFESKKWELDAEGKKVLDELTILLKANPNLSLKIYAYTDSRGKTSDNLELSNNRAESVSIYLKSKGVSSKQFITKGCGESQLINHCANLVECSDEEHAVNRRIEFEFIWK